MDFQKKLSNGVYSTKNPHCAGEVGMVCVWLKRMIFRCLCQTQRTMKKLIITFLILLATIIAIWA